MAVNIGTSQGPLLTEEHRPKALREHSKQSRENKHYPKHFFGAKRRYLNSTFDSTLLLNVRTLPHTMGSSPWVKALFASNTISESNLQSTSLMML